MQFFKVHPTPALDSSKIFAVEQVRGQNGTRARDANWPISLPFTAQSPAMPPASTPMNVHGRHSPVSLGTDWCPVQLCSTTAWGMLQDPSLSLPFISGGLLFHIRLARNVLLRFLSSPLSSRRVQNKQNFTAVVCRMPRIQLARSASVLMVTSW